MAIEKGITYRARNANTPVEYTQHPWGDLIRGTKEQIQSLGIGLGRLFPGELGAPVRRAQMLDPRGFSVRVERISDAMYSASIRFPGWPENPWDRKAWVAVAPGVTKRSKTRADVFLGSAEALISARIARADQLPGPGRPRATTATWAPDGSLATKGRSTVRRPGSKRIVRQSSGTFEVSITIAHEEASARRDRLAAAESEWERLVASIPRPAKLEPLSRCKVMDLQSYRSLLSVAECEWERFIASLPRPAKLEPLPQWQVNRIAERGIAPYRPRLEVIDLQSYRATRRGEGTPSRT